MAQKGLGSNSCHEAHWVILDKCLCLSQNYLMGLKDYVSQSKLLEGRLRIDTIGNKRNYIEVLSSYVSSFCVEELFHSLQPYVAQN